jgi:hypothetical protein
MVWKREGRRSGRPSKDPPSAFRERPPLLPLPLLLPLLPLPLPLPLTKPLKLEEMRVYPRRVEEPSRSMIDPRLGTEEPFFISVRCSSSSLSPSMSSTLFGYVFRSANLSKYLVLNVRNKGSISSKNAHHVNKKM